MRSKSLGTIPVSSRLAAARSLSAGAKSQTSTSHLSFKSKSNMLDRFHSKNLNRKNQTKIRRNWLPQHEGWLNIGEGFSDPVGKAKGDILLYEAAEKQKEEWDKRSHPPMTHLWPGSPMTGLGFTASGFARGGPHGSWKRHAEEALIESP
jgi:hypothetical protein